MAMDLQPSDWNHATCMSSRSDVSVDGKKKKKTKEMATMVQLQLTVDSCNGKKKKKRLFRFFVYLFFNQLNYFCLFVQNERKNRGANRLHSRTRSKAVEPGNEEV